MSNYVTVTAFAASYDNQAAAEADYQLVKDLYYGLGLMDTFDAAVLIKQDNGKVKIAKKHEQPTRQGARAGAGWGLAAGLAIACFPAAALSAGLLGTSAAIGAITGALAGHVVGGMSRSDLKDIGESLDGGQAALVVIAATDVGDRVAKVLKSARKVVTKAIKADQKELDKELEAASKA